VRRTRWTIGLAVVLVLAAGCSSEPQAATQTGSGSGATPAKAAAAVLPLQGPTAPTEYVGLTTQLPIDRASFDTIASQLFGKQAAAGHYLKDLDLGTGLHLSSAAHPSSASQVALTVTMSTTGAKPPTRTVTRVPASLGHGATFISTVDAALAQAASVKADDPSDLAPFRLEYRSTSAEGGKLTLSVVFDPATGSTLEVKAQGPTTSLSRNRVNQAATSGRPFETIYGLVWFGVARDQFDFFANRAYGLSAGKAQNFKDFELVPHNWLRLTVTPQLDQDRVDVAFEVVTLDGKRIPVAKAPASLVAGEQFMQTVFRMADNTEAQEKAKPGSSTPWEVPFYYDDPDGGGVVEVIAQAKEGKTQIAYSIESPAHQLDDVPFVPYAGKVVVPKDWDAPPPSCKATGSAAAPKGKFDITFDPSSTVRGSDLKAPLKGTVYGSIYKASDVKITGPLPGTKAVANIHQEGVDTVDGPSKPYLQDTVLPSGNYQVLGFMDIDGNADPADPAPDEGDPVMIPIGGYDLECARQAITAQFAIVLPAGVN